MSEKKGKGQTPQDENRGVEDILGGLLGSNAAGMPQGGSNEAPSGGGGDLAGGDLAGMLGGLMGGGGQGASAGGGDLAGMLGGLMGGGAQGASSGGDLMGMLGGLMGGGAQGGSGGSGDLMGMLGGLLGGGSQQGSGVSANAPSILSALLPLVLGMLGGGGGRSGQIDLDQRTSNELQGMLGAAQSGSLDMHQLRSSGVVQDVAAQTGASHDEVANTLAQLMQMLGNQR